MEHHDKSILPWRSVEIKLIFKEEKKNFLNCGIHTAAQLLNILDKLLDQLSETVLDMESENERLSKMEANIANTISVLQYLQKTDPAPTDDDED